MADRTKFAGKGQVTETTENLSGPKVKGGLMELVFGDETLVEGFNKVGEWHGSILEKRESERMSGDLRPHSTSRGFRFKSLRMVFHDEEQNFNFS